MMLIFSTSSYASGTDFYSGIKQVVLSGQFKSVKITAHSDPQVAIERLGDKNAVSLQQSGSILLIKTASKQNSFISQSIVSGNISNISIGENSNSVVSIGGIEGHSATGQPLQAISIAVPKGTSISLQGSIVNARIGDTQGQLALEMRGAGTIEAGSVGDVSADLAGAMSVHIARVTGNLSVDITGSGKLSVDGGEINRLNIETSGVGNVNVNAVAEQAKITLTGASTVNVKHVKSKPDISLTGAASINIGNY